MSEAEMVGFTVIALTTLVGLFLAIYKPLNENTKAMTSLTVMVEQLTSSMEHYKVDLEEYKEKVRQSQQRQWDKLDEHSCQIAKHDIEIETLKKGGRENEKH